MKQKKRTQS